MRPSGWLVFVLAAATLSCARSVPCPDAWEDSNEDETRCDPPPEVVEATERRLTTGIFGYGLGCYATDDEDSCGCAVDGLIDERVAFRLVELDADGSWTERELGIWVEDDATYEAELRPGVTYHFTSAGSEYGVAVDGERLETFTLAEGEVLFLRVTVMVSC